MTTTSGHVRRRFWPLLALVAAAFAGIAGAQTASAQDWPSKPVRILVPYAAGGNSDSMARITAQRLAEAFGQQFVVENRIGANGAIAADAVARAAPDGAHAALGRAAGAHHRARDEQGEFRPAEGLRADQRGRDQPVRAGREQDRSGRNRRGVRRLGESRSRPSCPTPKAAPAA